MKPKKENQNDIVTKVEFLSDREHIQKRPSMYIGNTETPDHLLHEVLDNSLDELINQYATYINISIDNHEKVVTIEDNGRGIPSYDITLPESNVSINSIVGLCVKLNSGGKFNSNLYAKSIGTHGVGLTCVNALSESFIIKVLNNNAYEQHTFLNAHHFKYETIKKTKQDTVSTLITFAPSPKFFKALDFDIQAIHKKLVLVKSIYPKSKIMLNGINIEHIPLYDYASFIFGSQEPLDKECMIHIHDRISSFEINCYITWDEESKTQVKNYGFVNLHSCNGKYQTNINSAIHKAINSTLKDASLTKLEALTGCKIFSNIFIKDPTFSSQNKVEMINDISDKLDSFKSELSKQLSRPYFKSWFDAVIADKNKNVMVKRALKSGKRVGTDNPLFDCKNSPGDTLYILEGDSAGGTLLDCRDVNTEAIYPLSGKILNVLTASNEKTIDSKKMKYLFEAIGVDFKTNIRRYDKIKILTDADSICGNTYLLYLDSNNNIKYDAIENIKDIKSIISKAANNDITIKTVNRIIPHIYTKDYIYRVKYENGYYVDYTDDHVIYCYNSVTNDIHETSPKNINVNTDLAIIPKRLTYKTFNPDDDKLKKSIAYLIGLYINCGYYINYCSEANDRIISSEIIKSDNVCLKFMLNTKNLNIVTQTLTEFGDINFDVSGCMLSITSKSILQQFNDFGMLISQSHKNNEYRIPYQIFNSPKQTTDEFLRGLYHSCDLFPERLYTECIVFSSQCSNIIKGLTFLLRTYGVIPQLTKEVYRELVIVSNKNDIDQLKFLNDGLDDSDIDYDSVEFNNNTPISNDLTTVAISSITEIPYCKNIVYDLEVEETNNFICGELGHIIHNSDGLHISVLLILAFWKFCKDIIIDGKLSVIMPPLYGTYSKKKFVPIYDKKIADKYKATGHSVIRFKGLGEMDADQLEPVIRNPLEYIVNPPVSKAEEELILSCINNIDVKRRLCGAVDEFNLESFLTKIS